MITARQHNDNRDMIVLELKGNGTIYQTADAIVTKTCDLEAAMKTLKHDNRLYRGIHTPLEENEYEACPYCGDEASHVAPDSISVCHSCDTVIEGSTIIGSVNL